MLDFLPETVADALRHVNLQYVYELRIRANKPTTVYYKDGYHYLSAYGVTETLSNALYCDENDVAECVFRAGEYSVYTVEEQIKKGFITAKNGARIGISGEYVLEKGQPHTIRNFTSLCVRFPHEIIGCGDEIYNKCLKNGLKNVLICSLPGLGKTTILRDLSRILCEEKKKNVLICDERGELSCGNLGLSSDVIKFAEKRTAFEAGLRAMRPEIIVTDELSYADVDVVKRTIFSGIYVLASAHFSNMDGLDSVLRGVFDRYVFLDKNMVGKVMAIYDKNGMEVGK